MDIVSLVLMHLAALVKFWVSVRILFRDISAQWPNTCAEEHLQPVAIKINKKPPTTQVENIGWTWETQTSHSNSARTFGKRIPSTRPAWATEQSVSLRNLVRSYPKGCSLMAECLREHSQHSIAWENKATERTPAQERDGAGVFKERILFLQPAERREVLKRLLG